MHFFWLHIFQWTYQEFFQIIKYPLSKTLVFTPNPEILLHAHRDRDFLYILQQATYLVPDAHWLYTASLIQEWYWFFRAWLYTFFSKKTLRAKYGELIQWSSITRDIVQFASDEGKNILVIDNYKIHETKNSFEKKKMHIQENLSTLFLEKFPFLHVHIVFDGEKTPEEIAKIIQSENISYVFSCIWMKTQESRLIEIFWFLPDKFPVVWLGVGSSFDYLLWLQKRSPVIFQKMWLEWLYRLIKEPIRRWKRILDAIYYFPKLFR